MCIEWIGFWARRSLRFSSYSRAIFPLLALAFFKTASLEAVDFLPDCKTLAIHTGRTFKRKVSRKDFTSNRAEIAGIKFMDHRDFKDGLSEPMLDEAYARVKQLEAEGAKTRTVARETSKGDDAAIYSNHPLLMREDETLLFKAMNYLKYRAAKRRSEFQQMAQPGEKEPLEIAKDLARAQEIRNAIVMTNLRLILMVGKSLGRLPLFADTDAHEWISLGTPLLVKFTEHFDISSGNKFSTPLCWALRNEFLGHQRKANVPKIPIEIEDPSNGKYGDISKLEDTNTPGPTELAETEELNRRLNHALDGLDAERREVLCYRYGLRGHQRLSLDQTSQKLAENGRNITRQRVSQMEFEGLEKLRRKVPELVNFLDQD